MRYKEAHEADVEENNKNHQDKAYRREAVSPVFSRLLQHSSPCPEAGGAMVVHIERSLQEYWEVEQAEDGIEDGLATNGVDVEAAGLQD